MPLYRYSGSSIIDEVRVIKNAAGSQRAYLHAATSADPAAMAKAIEGLTAQGLNAVACEVGGKPVLEIRGFKQPEELQASLQQVGVISGTASPEKIAEDKITFKEWFKSKSLYLVSLLYLGGDIGFMAYEHMEAKKASSAPKSANKKDYEAKTGLDKIMGHVAGYGYFAGSLTSLASLMLKPDPAKTELHKISKAIVAAGEAEGIALEESNQIALAAKRKDDISNFRRTFTKYPSEIMNVCFATAGVGISYNNYRKFKIDREFEQRHPELRTAETSEGREHRLDKLEHKLDIGLGLGTVTSGVLGTVLTEKAVDPRQPKKAGIDGFVEDLKNNPLKISGYGYLVSTFIHLISTSLGAYNIRRHNIENPADKKGFTAISARMFFVITNFAAELIMAFSSKGHGEGVKSDATMDNTITAMIAQTILAKPANEREALIDKMADILTNPKTLALKKEQAEKLLREQLSALEKNPWAKAMAPAVAKAEVAPEVVAAEEKAPAQAPEKAGAFGITPREKTAPMPTSLMDRALAEPSVAGVTL